MSVGTPAPSPTGPGADAAAGISPAGGAPSGDGDSGLGPEEKAVLAEFRAIAAQLEAQSALFVGRSRVSELRRAVEEADPDSREAVDRREALGRELLRLGENQPALAAFQEALRQEQVRWAAQTATGTVTGESTLQAERLGNLIFRVIIAAIRVGEVGNCVLRHTATSCILPLAPDAVHVDRGGAETAMSYAREYLSLFPGDLKAIWFLNVAAMQAGAWPAGVPEAWRLPASSLTSRADIGHFRNVAPAVGITAFDQAGGSITEDFDGDGLIDIMTSTFDPWGPPTLLRNRGDGTFADITRQARLHAQLGGLNLVQGDYDNDGDPDVLILRGGWLEGEGRIRKSLLRNNGDLTFTDVTARAGLIKPVLPTQTAAWADMDGDGDLDLYVGHEGEPGAGGGMSFHPASLYRNNGDGTFTDVAAAAGVTNDRFAKGVAWGDFDGDGAPDIYVSNIGVNRLYRNNRDGTFTDVAAAVGVEEPVGRSFATWFFDHDNDGDLDLFVAAYVADVADVTDDLLGRPPHRRDIWPRLYRNDGGRFTDITQAAGLAHSHLPMGANFGDINEDGYPDIYLGTGAPAYEALMPNAMYLNNTDGTFTDVTFSGGFGHLQKGHGVSFADLDNDGDADLFHQLGGFFPGDRFANALFENPGHGRRFVSVSAIGRRANRSAVGARLHLRLRTARGDRSIYRWVGTGGSFGASSLEQSIGLGDATAIRSLEIIWPGSGTRQVFEGIPVDSFIRVTEGEDRFLIVPRSRLRLGAGGGAQRPGASEP